MNITSLESVIEGNIEALAQGAELVSSLTDEQYCQIVTDYAHSSIGEHFRHIIDLFLAVTTGYPNRLVNYDLRRRGTQVERCRQTALTELADIQQWLCHFLDQYQRDNMSDDDLSVEVISEVSLVKTEAVSVQSSYIRELIFVGSHAVHHYALIAILAKLQGVKVKDSFGIAPTTASYLRNTPEHTQK